MMMNSQELLMVSQMISGTAITTFCRGLVPLVSEDVLPLCWVSPNDLDTANTPFTRCRCTRPPHLSIRSRSSCHVIEGQRGQLPPLLLLFLPSASLTWRVGRCSRDISMARPFLLSTHLESPTLATSNVSVLPSYRANRPVDPQLSSSRISLAHT